MSATTPAKKATESNGPTESSKYRYDIGDVTVELPSLKNLPPKVSRRTRKLNSEDRFWTTLEILLGEDSPEIEALEGLDADTFEDFSNGWSEFSGIDLGKSKASPR